MANEVVIKVKSTNTVAKDIAKEKSSVASEGSALGKAAGEALSDSFNRSARNVDLAKTLDDSSSNFKSESDKLGKLAGDSLSESFGKAVQAANPASALTRSRGEVDSEASKLGKSAADSFNDATGRGIVRGGFGATIAKQKTETDVAATKAGKSAGDNFAAGLEDGAKKADVGGGISSGLSKGKAGLVAAGAALGSVAGKAINDAMDLMLAKSNVAAQTGIASGKAGDAAGRVYADGFAKSAGEAANAVSIIVRSKLANINDNGAIDSLSQKMIAFSQTTGFGMEETAQAIKRMLVTGLVPDANLAFDVLTTGYQTLGVDSADLLATFGEYSVQFQKLGLNGPEALSLISQFLQAGARDTDVAADMLKEFAIRSVDMSTTSVEAYRALGLSAGEMAGNVEAGGSRAQGALQLVIQRLQGIKDPVEQNRIGVMLFGTQWEDTAGKINGINFGPVKNSLADVKGASDNLVYAARPVENAWTQAWRGVTNAVEGTISTLARVQSSVGMAATAVRQINSMRVMNDAIMAQAPRRAAGGPVGNGPTLMNEQGPEMVKLPSGSMVMPASNTSAMGGGGSSGPVTVILEFVGSGDKFMEAIQESVRAQGGNVQQVIGSN